MINISGSIQQGFMSTGFYVKQGFMSTGFYVLHLGHKTKISFPQIQGCLVFQQVGIVFKRKNTL